MRSVFVSAVLAASPALAKANPGAAEEAESGNFLPFSQSPNASRTYVTVLGGYDTAHGGPLLTSGLQARLQHRVYLLLDGNYEAPDDQTLEPAVTGQVILLEQAQDGLDLAVSAGWERSGFAQEADVTGRVAAGRHVDGVYLVGNAAVGVGARETYGELDLGGITEVVPHLSAGVDARARDTASTWQVQAGPVATVTSGELAVTVVADVSAVPGTTGALAMLGMGAVF